MLFNKEDNVYYPNVSDEDERLDRQSLIFDKLDIKNRKQSSFPLYYIEI